MTPETVLDCFDLHEVADDRFRAPVAAWPQVPWAYGGLLIGQAGLAARHTAAGRHLRSLHLSFVSRTVPGPVEISVERAGDQRRFAQRVVRIEQDGALRVVGTVLLHDVEEGPSHQLPMPDVVGPEEAPAGGDWLPVEVRDVSDGDAMSRKVADPAIDQWYRAAPRLVADDAHHEAMLGYISDLSLLQTAWRPVPDAAIHVVDKVISNTLTHSIWLHQPVRLDDWVLLHAHAPRAHGGRALNTAHVFDRGGVLVATVTAEALMRFRESG